MSHKLAFPAITADFENLQQVGKRPSVIFILKGFFCIKLFRRSAENQDSDSPDPQKVFWSIFSDMKERAVTKCWRYIRY